MTLYRKPLQEVEEDFHPLTVGAAYGRSFVCRVPTAWGGPIVLAKAFKFLPLHDAGWREDETCLADLGSDGTYRRWRVSR